MQTRPPQAVGRAEGETSGARVLARVGRASHWSASGSAADKTLPRCISGVTKGKHPTLPLSQLPGSEDKLPDLLQRVGWNRETLRGSLVPQIRVEWPGVWNMRANKAWRKA